MPGVTGNLLRNIGGNPDTVLSCKTKQSIIPYTDAYNISDDASDIMLKDLAGIIADQAGRKVVFELPDAVEAAGFSKATTARLDSAKINKLGWKAAYDIKEGLERTIEILKSLD